MPFNNPAFLFIIGFVNGLIFDFTYPRCYLYSQEIRGIRGKDLQLLEATETSFIDSDKYRGVNL
jgi:hypothetical protein